MTTLPCPSPPAPPARRLRCPLRFRLAGRRRRGALFLVLYYVTLGLLPWVFAYPTNALPGRGLGAPL